MKHNKFIGMLCIMMMSILPVCGQMSEKLKPGRIDDAVACRADAEQVYALFLPSYYTAEKKWPILFAFDPGAQTRIPLELFSPAAEKYGCLIVCPKNVRNGPWEPILKAIKAVWQDVEERFSIDEKRIYTVGFSGGARVASAFPLVIGIQAAGIIGCGAGLAFNIKPEQVKPTFYYGIVGLEDFNYREFVTLSQGLTQAQVKHAIDVTDGQHQWPSEEACTRAAEWLELAAMKSGARPIDHTLCDSIYLKMAQKGEELEAANKSYYAAAFYEYALSLLPGLKDTAEFEAKLTRLKSSKAYEEFVKAEKKRCQYELALSDRFADVFSLIRNIDPAQTRLTQVIKDLQIDDLLKMERDKEDVFTRAMGKRLLLELQFRGSQEGEAQLLKGDARRAVIFFEITVASGSEISRHYYNLTCAYALAKERKKALKSLKKAIDLGFSNAALMESDKDLDPLRKEKEFSALMRLVRERK